MQDGISPQREECLTIAIQRRLPSFSLDVCFQVLAGRTVLFGPSGSGKSLTLQAIAGLFPLDHAHVSNGATVWQDSKARIFIPPQRRRIGYLPQNYALFPHLTVAQNIAFGQRQKGARARERSAELIALMSLQGLERERPAHLSGGQQQRVALARALASEPELLLLDEPWSALDAPVRATLRAEILRFYEQFRVPLVLVTHDAADAQELADTVVMLHQGRVLQVGTPEEVFRAPRTPQIAELVGMRARWKGVISAVESVTERERLATIQVEAVTLQAYVSPTRILRPGQMVEIGLRADEIALCPPGGEDAEPHSPAYARSNGVLASATITRLQARGPSYTATVSLAPQMQLDIPVPRWQQRAFQFVSGMPVTFRIPCEAVHLFEPDKGMSEHWNRQWGEADAARQHLAASP